MDLCDLTISVLTPPSGTVLVTEKWYLPSDVVSFSTSSPLQVCIAFAKGIWNGTHKFCFRLNQNILNHVDYTLGSFKEAFLPIFWPSQTKEFQGPVYQLLSRYLPTHFKSSHINDSFLWGYKAKLWSMNSKQKPLNSEKEQIPSVKVREVFSYPFSKHMNSGYWMLIKSTGHVDAIRWSGKDCPSSTNGLSI